MPRRPASSHTAAHPSSSTARCCSERRVPPVEAASSRRWRWLPSRSTRRWLLVYTAVVVLALVLLLDGTATARAASLAAAAPPVPASLTSVIDALRNWLVGLLAAVATLFLTLGGLRYITAGGDPAQVERAKGALRSAVIGYSLAALAPLLVSILTSVVG